jgi:hypothetical protein
VSAYTVSPRGRCSLNGGRRAEYATDFRPEFVRAFNKKKSKGHWDRFIELFTVQPLTPCFPSCVSAARKQATLTQGDKS